MKYVILLMVAFSLNFSCKECEKCPECPERPECYNGKTEYVNGVRDNSVDFNNTNVKLYLMKVDSTDSTYILTGKVVCTFNDGKNDARNIEVTVLLPNEVKILEYNGPNKCLVASKEGLYPTDGRIHAGIIRFSKDSLRRDPQESFDISVTTSKLLKSNATSPNFSIFVYNQSPEINYKDNFWSWK